MSTRSEPSREIERIRFNGTDSEDVTDFVQAVKRVAMDQGRQRDQEWMFDYAESCLGGPAIRWFTQRQAESEALASWDALRYALLNRFEPPSDKYLPHAAPPANLPQSITIAAPPRPRSPPEKYLPRTAPPANLPQSITIPAPPRSQSPADSVHDIKPEANRIQKGRLKLLDLNGTLLGYCRGQREELDEPCMIYCNTVVASEAQIFEYELPPKGKQLARLKLIDSGSKPLFFALLKTESSWIPFLMIEDFIEIAGGFTNVWTLTKNELTLSFISNLASGERSPGMYPFTSDHNTLHLKARLNWCYNIWGK
ncbi:hypothetical protein FRB94_005591 [Tulasnella sp. JGI-2019a]|nr:hypothetical protein FRB94_005591 [Tulasnella sp. JGI-2019a]